jgi:rRNA maturation endonuclease Nob1
MAIPQVIQQCDGWHPKYSNNKSHPLIDMLVWGKKQPKGWARWHDDRVSGNNSIKHDTSKHLTSSLNVLLVDMKRETDRYSELVELAATRGVRGQGPTAMLQHAFDVGKTKVRDCNKIYNEKRGTMERKKRSDAGKTLANSERKREQQCTPLNYFEKLKRQQYPGEVLKDDELRESYTNLSEEDRLRCVHGAEGLKTMLKNLEAEVQRVMQHTNGCISWRRLAEQIAGGEKNV